MIGFKDEVEKGANETPINAAAKKKVLQKDYEKSWL